MACRQERVFATMRSGFTAAAVSGGHHIPAPRSNTTARQATALFLPTVIVEGPPLCWPICCRFSRNTKHPLSTQFQVESHGAQEMVRVCSA